MSTFSSDFGARALRGFGAVTLGVALFGFASACTPDACLRQSDCAPAFMCSAGTCVPETVDGGASADASIRDAGRIDAGTDAAVADLGMADGSAIDAAMSDGGTLDAGVDAAP